MKDISGKYKIYVRIIREIIYKDNRNSDKRQGIYIRDLVLARQYCLPSLQVYY